MIVVTLLLILVAVTLLVLGLVAGSSTMLISSIVASLLAAVALVIGARQAATRRRATVAGGVPASPEDDPFLAESQSPAEFATAGARRATGPAEGPRTAGTYTAQGARAAESAQHDAPVDDYPPPPPPGASPVSPADPFSSFPPADPFSPADSFSPADPLSPADPPARGFDDDFPPPPGPAGDYDEDLDEDLDPRRDPGLDAGDLGTARGDYARTAPAGAASEGDVDSDFSGSDPILDRDADMFGAAGDERRAPDYDRASSVIGAARSESQDESWRRDPDAGEARPREDDDFGYFDSRRGADLPDAPLLEDDDEPGDLRAAAAPPADDLAEPDEDDPDDEPYPQAVRPGDAVRVARMDNEVFVVDGRPRYHMADCQHLAGRLTEPLPVSEAVELGFNPCGLCRPVDRLVAHAAQR